MIKERFFKKPVFWQSLLVCLILAGILGCFYLLSEKIFSLSLTAFTDPNEPWNLFKVQELIKGEPLYHKGFSQPASGQNFLITNNYPPLSFYLVYGLHRLLGENILAIGRFLAAFSAVGCGFMVAGFAARLWGKPPSFEKYLAGLSAFFCFFLFQANAFKGYFAMYDPQWCAELLSLCGMFIFLTRRSYAGIFWTSFFLVLAGFFKHNLITFPLSITLFLLVFDWRKWLFWCGCGFFLTLFGLGLCALFYGRVFFENVMLFEAGRMHGWFYFQHRLLLISQLVPFVALEMLMLWQIKIFPQRQEALLWAFVAVIGLGLGLYGATGWGSDVNIFFDTALGICVLAGGIFPELLILGRTKTASFLELLRSLPTK